MRAHYEMRQAGVAEPREHTGSNLEVEFERMSEAARRASLAEPGVTFEVRYRGWSEAQRDLLVAAWLDGEELDLRTEAAREEHQAR